MNTTSVKEYCTKHGIQRISAVRENENGYKFMTFVDLDNMSENMYFSKNASERVNVGDAPAIIKDAFIAETENEAGEERLKITFTEYQTVDDLFGITVVTEVGEADPGIKA